MCAIAGILRWQDLADRAAVQRMCNAMAHRGPDDAGLWRAQDGSVCLGHRRLSVLDTTQHAAQPMLSPDGRYILVYNGELYNFCELRNQLAAQGIPVGSSGDTEVVLAWLVQHGPAGLADLRGMFALALWDTLERRLLLARDPFGIKPLYLFQNREQLLFASELRGLLASELVPRKLAPAALRDYLAWGFTLEPHTIVQGVRVAPPGRYLLIDQHGTREHLAIPPAAPLTPLASAFTTSVQRHLASDVPIGAFLSSGVDSSAIVGAMHASNCDVRTLTVTFPDATELCEGTQAHHWANKLGTQHTELPVTGSDLLALLPTALAAQDQPTLDAVNTYVVAKAARDAGLTVALSGLGGDELFGGYPSFQDVPKAARLRKHAGPFGPIAAAALRPWEHTHQRRIAKIADLLRAPQTRCGIYAARRRVLSLHQCQALAPALPQPGERDLVHAAPPFLSDLETIENGQELDAVSLLELSLYMRNQLLRDCDSMSMAVSLEIRVPFLDADFASIAWQHGHAVRDRKQTFSRQLASLLPEDIHTRPKMGFTMPFAHWLCGPLKNLAEESLHALPACFNSHAVSRLWQAFLANPDRVGWSRPWSLLALSHYIAHNRLSL